MAGNQENEIDQALILRMGQGDEEALRDFILRYQDRVYGTVAKMIGPMSILMSATNASPRGLSWTPSAG